MKRNRRQIAEFVVQSIRDLGVDPHSESRLMKMHALLCVEAERMGGTLSPEHPSFDTAVESLRDFQLLEFVFDQLHRAEASKSLRDLVKKLLKDSTLSQEDMRASKGRDAQFELYVLSLCYAANMHPVQYEEPDVTCFLEGKKYGIAAKRVKSLSKLEARVRRGASQVSRSGLPGIVALDTCLMLTNQSIIYTTLFHSILLYSVHEKRWTHVVARNDGNHSPHGG